MKNYKWGIKRDFSTTLNDLFERKAMGQAVCSTMLSPKKCYEWLKKEENLILTITEINRYSSPSYGNKIGRYYYVERGADVLAAIVFMEYARQEVSWKGNIKPDLLLLKTCTIDDNGIVYTELNNNEISPWFDEKCNEFVQFVKSLNFNESCYLGTLLRKVRVTCTMQFPIPTGKILSLEIDNHMTYGELKHKMEHIFHVRPWYERRGGKNNQEEKNSKILSEMGISSGVITVAADATIDQLSHVFRLECHKCMNWRYAKRPWQRISNDIKLTEVDNTPNLLYAILTELFDL